MTGTVLAQGLAGEARSYQNRTDPSRRRFSVLCYRGWCDYDFKCRDIPAMISALTGVSYPPATTLPRRECPTPGECECACHDGSREAS